MSHKCFNGLPNCVNHGKVDTATLEAAKQYTDSQRLAYTTRDPDFVWDGDIDGRRTAAFLENENGEKILLVNVTEEFLDPMKIESIILRSIIRENDTGIQHVQDTVVMAADCEVDVVEGEYGGVQYFPDNADGFEIVMEAEDYYDEGELVGMKGTSVIYRTAPLGGLGVAYSYVHRIIFSETIHPIDPKFIPPMDALILNANDKQYRIAVDETGTLITTEVT